MIRMTIATDDHGNVIGAIQHSGEKPQSDGSRAAVSFAPGARLHEVDVGPELDMTKIKDVAKFHDALGRYVPVAAE